MEASRSAMTAERGGSAADRDELISKNLGLVQHVARQFAHATKAGVEYENLVSAGTVGLINAVENFDPSRGLAFSTFAAPRIRGAILDDLRSRDPMPRSLRRKQRDLARAREGLAARLGRNPTDQEVARELNVGVEKVWEWQRDVEYASQVSLPEGGESSAASAADELLGQEDDVESIISRAEEAQILRDEILALKEQERLVLSLYYFEELKLHEIASILGVTESRISQVRSKAITKLRDRLIQLRQEQVL